MISGETQGVWHVRATSTDRCAQPGRLRASPGPPADVGGEPLGADGPQAAPPAGKLPNAIAGLDTVQDEAVRAQILDWIQQSYEDRGGGIMIGLFGRCYLGHPYVDHRMSLDGSILEHFKGDEERAPCVRAVPGAGALERGRLHEPFTHGRAAAIRIDGTSAI